MIKILNNGEFKNKKFTFDDEGITMNYTYFFSKLHTFLKQINRNNGNIIKLLQKYNTHNLIKNTKCKNITELSKHNYSYITKFTLDIHKTGFDIEYEYLLYTILYKHFGTELLQFPRNETYYISREMCHMGFVLRPITSIDYKIDPKEKTYITLKELLDNRERYDIKDIINIVLQVLCTLSVTGQRLEFTHYNCTLDNILIYDITEHIHTNTPKYLQFNLQIGEVFVPCKYIIFFKNLDRAHINIRNFKSKTVKDIIIKHWLETDTKMSKYSPNYDVYTFINDLFETIRSSETGFLSKRITGLIDKKTMFSILCKNIMDECGSGKMTTYKNPNDLIQTFYEMGLSSLRLPSNKKIQVYGYGKFGSLIKTRLTYSNIKQNIENETTKSNKDYGIDINDCSWKEIRTIAREFGLKSRGKGINKAFLKRKIREEIPFYKS